METSLIFCGKERGCWGIYQAQYVSPGNFSSYQGFADMSNISGVSMEMGAPWHGIPTVTKPNLMQIIFFF